MNKRLMLGTLAVLLAVAQAQGADTADQSGWKQILKERLVQYGHRNWIVIADSAYPDQSKPGIETVVSHADQTDVLRTVLTAVADSKHVRPIVYTDRELNYVTEADAPGIGFYRSELKDILPAGDTKSLLHEQIISKLDKAGETFRILIIKTNLTIPYTSVFLELRAGYWSDTAEQRLRATMAKAGP
jgi:phosphoenolpyruvate-protein kinase (PTS system EI component)